jgi:precorrin-6Y C5,15-methyltransferase (decarboxylating)
MRDILGRFGMTDVSIIQISVSKLNSKNLFETQSSPWIITARAGE